MLKIACLDPTLLQDVARQAQLWRDIRHTCGWVRAKAIADIPRLTGLIAQMKDGMSKKMLQEVLMEAQDRLAVISIPSIPSQPWPERADRAEWVTDVVSERTGLICGKPLLLPEAFWDADLPNNGRLHLMHPAFLRALEILCRHTKRLDVIDPFMTYGRSPILKQVAMILEGSEPSGHPELRLHLPYKTRDSAPCTFNPQDEEETLLAPYRYLEAGRVRVRLMIWEPAALHSRFLLGDRGGFHLGESLNQRQEEVVTITLINTQVSLRQEFSPTSPSMRRLFIRAVPALEN